MTWRDHLERLLTAIDGARGERRALDDAILRAEVAERGRVQWFELFTRANKRVRALQAENERLRSLLAERGEHHPDVTDARD